MFFENVQDIGFECEDNHIEFLNSDEGQTLEKMYELAYGSDDN